MIYIFTLRHYHPVGFSICGLSHHCSDVIPFSLIFQPTQLAEVGAFFSWVRGESHTNAATDNICILFGYGNGSFTTVATYSTGIGSNPSFVAVDDLNKDNHLDLVIANWGINNVLVFFGLDNDTFSSPKSYSVGYDARPQSIIIADFNNDNLLDIAIANYGTNRVEILFQTC
jgi:hypothetical protein